MSSKLSMTNDKRWSAANIFWRFSGLKAISRKQITKRDAKPLVGTLLLGYAFLEADCLAGVDCGRDLALRWLRWELPLSTVSR